ncbi:MAG: hypothetical protein R6X33_04515 [Candidatus Brocadiia bacterium]
MSESNATEDPRSNNGDLTPDETSAGEAIGRGRKLRLAVLAGVLALLVAATLGVRAWVNSRQAARRQEAADAVASAREALRKRDTGAAAEALKKAEELDPTNRTIPLVAVQTLYAGGILDGAVEQFNQLVPDEEARIGPEGLQYIRSQEVLWNLAGRIAGRLPTLRERALALCRWFALYVQPTRGGFVPSEPIMVVWRGRGHPSEIAWTYAELARHAGLACKIVTFRQGDRTAQLVSVESADNRSLLLDPAQGVPLLDPDSGEWLSLTDLNRDYNALERLLAMAGRQAPTEEEFFGSLEQVVAAHPFALTQRFQAFQNALQDVRPHPVLAVDARAEGIMGPADLWKLPRDILRELHSPEKMEAIQALYSLLPFVVPPRQETALGRFDAASEAYAEAAAEVRTRMEEADVAAAVGPLERIRDDLSFFAVINACQAGRLQEAADALEEYRKEYPDGRWPALEEVLRTELALALGKNAEWPQMPAERRLYAELRRRGLLGPPEGLLEERNETTAPDAPDQ